jgi:hypothetical protein
MQWSDGMRMGIGHAGLLLAGVVLALASCGSGPTTDSPTGVVRTALDRLAAKDLDGLEALACAGQEDIIRDQLGLPGAVGSELLPGLDTEALLDAVVVDVEDLDVGEATVDGDVAQVPVSGEVGITFDAEKMRPLMRQVMESQGQSMTDEQLDALLAGLEAYGQSVPLDESIRVVREDGAWKICQESVTP